MSKFYHIIVCFLFLIKVCCISITTYGNTDINGHIDSLRDLLNHTELHDTTRLNAMIELCSELKSKSPGEAINYGMSAINMAKYLELDYQHANALSSVGVVYWQMGDFKNAMDYLLEARKIHTENDNKIGIASTSTNIGLIYSDQSYYERALEYYFEALNIFEEKDHAEGLAPVFNNIGLVYQNRGDYDLSERYHASSLEIKQEIGDVKGMGYSYNNLGILNKYRGNYEKAVDYFQRSLKIRQELEDKREIASTLSRMGYLYIMTGNYSYAIENLYKALNLYDEVNDQSGLSQTYNYLGQSYMRQNNFSKAEDYLNESLNLAQSIGLTRMITESYKCLAQIYAEQDDYKKAYFFQHKHISTRDSIFNEESRRKIYEFQMLFDSEQKEREIELYRKSSQINELNYKKQRMLKNFLLAGVILVVVLLFLLFNRYLVINKTNRLLEKQKSEISKSNEELVKLNKVLYEQKKKVEDLNQKLRKSEKELIEANTAKDKFFSIISHDLRNPFASIVSFSRMLKRDIDNLDKEELKQLTLELDKATVKINDLLENLLHWSRTQTGKIKYNPGYIEIIDIINNNINLFLPTIKEKEIKVENNVDGNLIVWADQNMTDTIIRNLLSNAIKFTHNKGKIKLNSKTDKKNAYISIEDNGVGIGKQEQEKLFRVESMHSTFGTHEEKGSGLGLLLCKEFVEKQKGRIEFESEEGKGSVFTFSLPLSSNNRKSKA